jgi:hypothetical protein
MLRLKRDSLISTDGIPDISFGKRFYSVFISVQCICDRRHSGLWALMTDLRLLNKESLWISRQQLIFALIACFAKAEALISIRCKSLADARSLFLSCLSHSSLALAPNFFQVQRLDYRSSIFTPYLILRTASLFFNHNHNLQNVATLQPLISPEVPRMMNIFKRLGTSLNAPSFGTYSPKAVSTTNVASVSAKVVDDDMKSAGPTSTGV